MDDELRRELNRIHGDIAIMRLAVARIWAKHFDNAETEEWVQRTFETLDTNDAFSLDERMSATGALDRLAPYLQRATGTSDDGAGS